MDCNILQGDALELLRTLPPESVHTCVTSPPYYNLRDYGVEGQIGNEASVEEYLQALVTVFREVRRVLRPDGTLWVNVGDSYATKSGSQPPTNTRNSCGHTAKRVPRPFDNDNCMCQFCETPCNNGLNCSDCAHEGKAAHDVLLCTGFDGSMEQYTENWKRKQMEKLGGGQE